MSKYNLGFVTDEQIFNHVKETVQKYRYEINLASFNKNLIDPIKLTFDSKVYSQTIQETVEAECIRQIDKTNSNHIGYFHQNMFHLAGNGWEVPKNGADGGFDVTNHERHIFCEVKNKHNTMNSEMKIASYIKMQDKLLHDKKIICYVVDMQSVGCYDNEWKLKIDGLVYSNPKIRFISISRLYDIAFGKNSYSRLVKILPAIVDDAIKEIA